jgi:hypothetical protein
MKMVEHEDQTAEGAVFQPSASAASRVAKVLGYAGDVVRSPYFAYPTVLLLQLLLLWGIWSNRDITYGDTSSYFVGAMDWAHGLHDNVVWSPLYIWFFGTFVYFVHDAPAAVMAHRVTIVLVASLLVLALTRALLPPAVALLVSVWWTVLPPNFNVEYEVHLFAVLPILLAAIIVARARNRTGRGIALAILAGTTLLLRNEILIATLLFGAAIVVAEWRNRRQTRPPASAYIRAYVMPLAVVLLLLAGAYWRSTVQGGQALAALRAKEGLNVCQIYAFSYQQEHPTRFVGSPWTDCGRLLTKTFGRPLPNFLQATEANPGAIAHFVGWNAHLLPSGLEVSLYGATHGSQTPGYFPVKLHRWYALALLLVTLVVIVGGMVLIGRPESRWLREAISRRRWPLILLASVSTSTIIVAFTQRPRPEYLYPLTITIMVVVGYCLTGLVSKVRFARYVPLFGIVLVAGLIATLGSYYHPGPRPLDDALARLQPFKAGLQSPKSVLIASGYDFQLCAYLSDGSNRRCTSPSLNSLLADVVGRRRFVDVLQEINASVVYADPTLASQPEVAPLLQAPEQNGWRVAASGTSAAGPWQVLVPATTSDVSRGGLPGTRDERQRRPGR